MPRYEVTIPADYIKIGVVAIDADSIEDATDIAIGMVDEGSGHIKWGEYEWCGVEWIDIEVEEIA